ncbi:MATE family efflux transporter [Desulfoluna sp.]|uniref:MATE family efflux transporter n=1 Tax=Desulfoluna sp. TaxID=2045199 RepID=UPI002627E322|nr:MATE family efflux transporter [Desulfoluna sp.]
MKNQLHSPWGITRFLTYITPSVLSILTISLYLVVDALFISRYAGTLAMAVVSIIMPLFSLCFGVGIMMAAGSSAIMGIEIGEGKTDAARKHFSLGFYFLVTTGVLIILLTRIFHELGALICKASEPKM